MNLAHNLPKGSGMVWIQPPHLDKADMDPQRLHWWHVSSFTPELSSWPAKQRGSWEKILIWTISWPQNHLVSIDATPPLHKGSWSSSPQTTLWSLSPSVTSVTWPSFNEVLKRFPWADVASCALPPTGTIVVDLLCFLSNIIYPSLTSGCEPSGS